LYIRERNTFYFRVVEFNFDFKLFKKNILKTFDGYVPIFKKYRKGSKKLKIWKIYLQGITQSEALFENTNNILNSDEKLKNVKSGTKIEVIFV
jgi:hypothetical protein